MTQQELSEKFKKYYVPVWAPPLDFAVAGGKGPYLFDLDGKKYLDFVSGIAVNALGHCHPDIVKVLRDQTRKPLHVSSLYLQEDRVHLAELLVENSFADRVFFCNSGTEAIEGAIKFARKWASKNFGPAKRGIISFRNGFHGRSYGALSATAQEKFHAGFEPLVPGFTYLEPNNIDAVSFAADPEKICAILIEPVQAEGGILPCSKEWLTALRRLCTERRILLIFDEIQTGLGRLGTLWGHQSFGVEPDIMTLAKALGGGIPLGAVLVRDEIANCLSVGDHGNTTGGSPVAAALGLVVLERLLAPDFLEKVRETAGVLSKELSKIAKRHPTLVSGVRGMGLIQGLALKTDVAVVVNACRGQGLLACKAGADVLRLLPPLNTTPALVRKACAIIANVLRSLESKGAA